MLVERLKKISRAITGDHSSATSPESETMLAADNKSAPEKAKRPIAENSNSSVQKFRLNFRSVSEEDLSAMASETLHDGRYIAPEPAPPCELKVGDKMPDGTIYAGISPDTDRAMFATPADAPLSYSFNEAQKYAKDLDAHGHQDWRVPTKGELNVLFSNRAAIGGFNVTGANPTGWYWSSSTYYPWSAWFQRFSDGYQYNYVNSFHSSVRCVR